MAFTRKRPPLPSFRVALCSHRPPSGAECAALCRASGSVPVKCVVVRPGIVIGFDVALQAETDAPAPAPRKRPRKWVK